jgi:hypothetical protein
VYLISLALYTGIIPGNRRSLFGPCRVMLPTYLPCGVVGRTTAESLGMIPTGQLGILRRFDTDGYNSRDMDDKSGSFRPVNGLSTIRIMQINIVPLFLRQGVSSA